MIGKTDRKTGYDISFTIGELHKKYPKEDSDDIVDMFEDYLKEKYEIGSIFLSSDGIQKSLIDDSFIKNCSIHPSNFAAVFKRLDKDTKLKLSGILGRKNIKSFTLSSLSDRDVECIVQEVYNEWAK